ncbi:N,N-dimethylaniline monooxygenase [Aureococcus anophagefferens]|nr:N,N-dimethylaniline monooxygenase [Aureococcus anophagefferens]
MSCGKKVCVIGGGTSGLAGMVVCFEKEARVGGIFNWGEDKNGVYDSVILTISSMLMAFSDFPSTETKYWTHEEYLKYLQDYCKNYELDQHIRFSTTVDKVELQAGDKWLVEATSKDGTKHSGLYDGVCVASGNFQTAKVPNFPGIGDFKGELVHASQYKRPDQFKDKNVVVIGLGESGADLAREVASVAKNAYACVRSLPAIIPRLPNYKDPTDAFTFRAHHFAYTTAVAEKFGVCYDPRLEKKLWGCGKLSSIAINSVCSGLVFGMFLKIKIYDGIVTRLKHLVTGDYTAGANCIGNEGEAKKNNSMIDVKAEADEAIEEHFEAWHRINAGNYFGGVLRHPLKFLTKNASFMPAIIDGSLQLKASGLEKINANSVTFGSGETVDCDAIVFCTGYKDQFQFFTDPKLQVFPDGNVRNMYRHCIRLDAPNLAYVGWVRPTSGGVPACSEMTARMKKFEEAAFAYTPDIKTLVLSQSQFFDSIALDIGCSINPWRHILDPVFLYKMYVGPFLPQAYRLTGPHARPKEAYAYVKSQHGGMFQNYLPESKFTSFMPFAGLMMVLDNLVYSIFGKFVILPFMAANMPKEVTDTDKNYAYGFDMKRRHAHLAELLDEGAKAKAM